MRCCDFPCVTAAGGSQLRATLRFAHAASLAIIASVSIWNLSFFSYDCGVSYWVVIRFSFWLCGGASHRCYQTLSWEGLMRLLGYSWRLVCAFKFFPAVAKHKFCVTCEVTNLKKKKPSSINKLQNKNL